MLARDTSVFGFSRTQRRGLSGQACTVAAFVQGQVSASSANLSLRCSPGRERGVKSRAALAFLPCLSQREVEKQLDRGSGWFVMPGCIHRGYAELERQARGLWSCPASSKKSAMT